MANMETIEVRLFDRQIEFLENHRKQRIERLNNLISDMESRKKDIENLYNNGLYKNFKYSLKTLKKANYEYLLTDFLDVHIIESSEKND